MELQHRRYATDTTNSTSWRSNKPGYKHTISLLSPPDTWQRHTLDDTLHQMAGMLIICLHTIFVGYGYMNRVQCGPDRSERGILLQNHETELTAERHVLAADTTNLTELWSCDRLSL